MSVTTAVYSASAIAGVSATPRSAEEVGEHLAGRRRLLDDEVDVAEARVVVVVVDVDRQRRRLHRVAASTIRLSCAQSTATSTRSAVSSGASRRSPSLPRARGTRTRRATRPGRRAPSRSPFRAPASARCVASSEPSASPSGLSCDVTTNRSCARSAATTASLSLGVHRRLRPAGASSSMRCVMRTPCSTARS